eukprot:763837-Hanusia_phi.AAC.4
MQELIDSGADPNYLSCFSPDSCALIGLSAPCTLAGGPSIMRPSTTTTEVTRGESPAVVHASQLFKFCWTTAPPST